MEWSGRARATATTMLLECVLVQPGLVAVFNCSVGFLILFVVVLVAVRCSLLFTFFFLFLSLWPVRCSRLLFTFSEAVECN